MKGEKQRGFQNTRQAFWLGGMPFPEQEHQRLCWWKVSKAIQHSPQEFNTITLHPVGSKFSSNNARESHHLWKVYHLGTAPPQPSPVSPTYIRSGAKLKQCTCLIEAYGKSLYLYACSLENCIHHQSEASSSEVLHQDIQYELLSLFGSARTTYWTDEQLRTVFNPEHLYRSSKQWKRDLQSRRAVPNNSFVFTS